MYTWRVVEVEMDVLGYLVECWTAGGYVLRGPSAMYGFQIYSCPECALPSLHLCTK